MDPLITLGVGWLAGALFTFAVTRWRAIRRTKRQHMLRRFGVV